MAHQSPNKRIKCQTILGKNFSSALSHPFRLELLTNSLNLTEKTVQKAHLANIQYGSLPPTPFHIVATS